MTENEFTVLFWSASILIFIWVFGRSVLLRYVVLPWRAKNRALPTDVQLLAKDLSAFPEAARVYAARASRQLTTLGFTEIAHLYLPQGYPGVDGYTSIWINGDEGSSAHVHSFVVRRRFEMWTHSMSFCTEFEDHRAVVTSNRARSSYRPDPNCDTIRWAGTNNLVAMHQLHAARVAALRNEASLFLPSADEIVGHMRMRNLQHLERQADAGEAWFDAAGGTYRLTLKGAYLHYCRLLWPIKQRTSRRHEAKLRMALSEAGMGAPENYPTRPKIDPAGPALDYGRVR